MTCLPCLRLVCFRLLGDLHSPLTAAGLPVRVGTIQCLADEKVVASALMNELHSVQLGRRDAPAFLPTCADFEFSGTAKCIALNYASIHAGPYIVPFSQAGGCCSPVQPKKKVPCNLRRKRRDVLLSLCNHIPIDLFQFQFYHSFAVEYHLRCQRSPTKRHRLVMDRPSGCQVSGRGGGHSLGTHRGGETDGVHRRRETPRIF